ncbi:MAG: hypothetical protein L6R36_004351 [Xanthoria steineri]|nr:MAG: hypothetical protein L6R36_004351 [Xanthoria steineri]
MVLLPISDYEERLIGKRLVTENSTFTTNGVKIFHNQPSPSSLVLNTSSSLPTSSPLQNLPTELRLHILNLLFEQIKPIDWLSAHYHAGATPASVIFASRNVHLEGRPLALKACTFDYGDLPTDHCLAGYGYSIIFGNGEGERTTPFPHVTGVGFDASYSLDTYFNEKHACERVSYG